MVGDCGKNRKLTRALRAAATKVRALERVCCCGRPCLPSGLVGVMAGLITGPEFIETFPACDEKVQGAARASLLQATYV